MTQRSGYCFRGFFSFWTEREALLTMRLFSLSGTVLGVSTKVLNRYMSIVPDSRQLDDGQSLVKERV